MIELSYPSGVQWYLDAGPTFLGPFDPYGGPLISKLMLRSARDQLITTPSIYHENAVVNSQIIGKVNYHPILSSCISTASATYPKSISMPIVFKNMTRKMLSVVGGVTGSDVCNRTYARTGANGTDTHVAAHYNQSSNTWILWTMQTKVSTDSTVVRSFSMKTYGNFRYYRPMTPATQFYADLTTLDYTIPFSGWASGIDWSKSQSYDTLSQLKPPYPITSTTQTNAWFNVYTADVTVTLSPTQLFVLLGPMSDGLSSTKFPVEGIPYGDLAMTASENINANKVNMLEFMSDLQHPWELIPKLSNLKHLKKLKKLKTYSDEFLRTRYGIMPTISDLETIWASFKRVAPYVDRNGFRLATASFVSTATNALGAPCRLEQRIKLAIGNEDSVLQALAEEMDNVGFLPTCNNIWDLVPFSFVIDWFVNVGEFLQRVDGNLRLERLNIRYVTMSRKQITYRNLIPATALPLDGYVNLVEYHRWTSDQCPLPALSPQSNNTVPDHWLEIGALIVSGASRP